MKKNIKRAKEERMKNREKARKQHDATLKSYIYNWKILDSYIFTIKLSITRNPLMGIYSRLNFKLTTFEL